MVKLSKAPKLMAIASGGGHWVQLLRLRPAFEGCDITYVTVIKAYKEDIGNERFLVINDANRWNKIGLIKLLFRVCWLLVRIRPDVIISTGAAPGYFALRFGKLMGAKTIWLDSIANIDQLSMSGDRVGPYADLWLTQWPDLTTHEGPTYCGAVL